MGLKGHKLNLEFTIKIKVVITDQRSHLHRSKHFCGLTVGRNPECLQKSHLYDLVYTNWQTLVLLMPGIKPGMQ